MGDSNDLVSAITNRTMPNLSVCVWNKSASLGRGELWLTLVGCPVHSAQAAHTRCSETRLRAGGQEMSATFQAHWLLFANATQFRVQLSPGHLLWNFI